jgi:uncharacterized delta-60 repeat protein
MKKLVLLAPLLFPLFASAQHGMLDLNFDADGIATFDVGPEGTYTGYDVAVQEDGKILFLGTAPTSEGVAAVVARLFPDGTVDASFAQNGSYFIVGANIQTDCRAMAVQPDGKIILVGVAEVNSEFGVVAVRLNGTDGSLDLGFGNGGFALVPATGNSFFYDVEVQSDGKIVAAGFDDGADGNVLVVRFNQDGSLDNSFSFDGKVTTDVNDNDGALGVVIGADGKITVAGVSESQIGMFTDTEGLLIRYNTDGTLDNTFGTNGVALYDLNGYAAFNDIVITGSGSMYVCGVAYTFGETDDNMLIAKLNNDGSYDLSFSMDGYDIYDFGGTDDVANELVLQPDGRILMVGSRDEATNDAAALIRYNDNGLRDQTFGTNGVVVTEIDDQSGFEAVALQPDLKIIAFGTSLEGTDTKAAMARYTSGMNVGIGEVKVSIGSTLIYPNPITDNHLTVEYELTSDQAVSIELIDLNGKLISVLQPEVEEVSGDYQKNLSLGCVPVGNYLMRLRTLEGAVNVRVLVGK